MAAADWAVASRFLPKPLDHAQVQVALGTPALHAFGNRGPKSLVQPERLFSQFPRLETPGKPFHRRPHPAEVVPELALQVAPHAVWLDHLSALHSPHAVLGVSGRHGPTQEFDPELLSPLLLPCFRG